MIVTFKWCPSTTLKMKYIIVGDDEAAYSVNQLASYSLLTAPACFLVFKMCYEGALGSEMPFLTTVGPQEVGRPPVGDARTCRLSSRIRLAAFLLSFSQAEARMFSAAAEVR